ncbi:XRE family transcriptional regulator, partial [Rhizobium sp. BR 318]
PMVRDLDSPLQKVGPAWRVTSPIDAWFLLAQNLTNDDISRYEAAALDVLGASDPRFEMEPDDRWMANVRGIQPPYSGLLRHGIGHSMILMALWGDRVRTVPDVGRRVDHIVRKLLQGADGHRWWSLSGDFRLLAEASPGAFLDAIEESLDRDQPPIEALFGSDGGGITGQEHLADLMWALESLAWSKQLMPRVTYVLARLDAIDTKPRRFTNGPANSLRNIHLLWHPETFATLDERLKALDLIRKREPASAWKLMIGILPQGRDHMTPSAVPRWRDYSVDDEEALTWGLVERGTTEISKRLLDDAGLDPQRWSDLLDCLADLVPGTEVALVNLAAAEPKMIDEDARATLWRKLRSTLHRHRQFPDADWSLDEPVLIALEKVYHRFAPADPIERVAWLFNQTVELPDRGSAGWETEQRDIEETRQRAAAAVFEAGGIPAIEKLARQVEAPGYIGKALYDAGLSPPEFDDLLQSFLKSDNALERDVAHGLVVCSSRDRDREWSTGLIEKALAEKWADEALLTLLRALPIERWVWNQISEIGGAIETTYWRTARVMWIDDREDDIVYAVRKLIQTGAPLRAVGLASRMRESDLPSDLVIEVLTEAAKQPFTGDPGHNELGMFRHHVAELMQILDNRDDVEREALATLEWNYLEVLEHSQRPAKALLAELSEQPKLFVDLLKAVYRKSDDEDGDADEPVPATPEMAKAVASRAYALLGHWNRIPGTQNDSSIDPIRLTEWIKEARKLAREAGRLDIGDSRIGHMLSSSPDGKDGNWPAEAVREVIDLFHSKEMIDGFVVGKMNRRGMTTRMPRDGGLLERREEARYRKSADAIIFDYPRTANALIRLADYYERDARREDEQAERLDWRG